tara:strand:+ start:9864 stop:10586 length:723 start_codon:yes stop_codon:yes gene_type:complete
MIPKNSKDLSAELLTSNWNDLTNNIKDNFSGERQEALLDLYTKMQEQIMMAPASGIEHFHNSFIGGYVSHVLNVMNCAERLYNMWREMGAYMDNYTREELMFVALNHDLGKVGDIENEYYIPNPSEWHRKNQGKIYTNNPDITHMSVPHRSLWLLQEFGIKVSQNEMIGILTHDGVYDGSNDTYLKSYLPERGLKANLPIVMHHADHMASRIEFENWKYRKESSPKNDKSKLFDELFGAK